MRLTLDAISNAPQCVTPLNDRQISFRGRNIPALENLGATKDFYDVLDFSDNDLIRIDNIPPLNRLRILLLANNRISRISDNIGVPKLESIVLTNNKIDSLRDLQPLTKCKHLERISLVDNPVTSLEHYRNFLIFSIPSLRFIDFQRVTDKERTEAKERFSGNDLLERIVLPRVAGEARKRHKDTRQPTPEAESASPLVSVAQRKVINTAITNATSAEEVKRLEKALKTAVIPADILAEMASADTLAAPPEALDLHSVTTSAPPPPPPRPIMYMPLVNSFPPPPPPPVMRGMMPDMSAHTSMNYTFESVDQQVFIPPPTMEMLPMAIIPPPPISLNNQSFEIEQPTQEAVLHHQQEEVMMGAADINEDDVSMDEINE